MFSNKIVKTITAFFLALFTFQCSHTDQQIYLVFFDYSKSAATLEAGNKEKFMKHLNTIWTGMTAGEELIIYPIHLLTETATSLLKIQKPEPKGDLNDSGNMKISKSKFSLLLKQKIFDQPDFPHAITAGTNMYPILRKIKRFQDNIYVSVLIVSDMKHDYLGESLDEIFGLKNKALPKKLAEKKVDALNLHSTLTNTNITIAIPGTYLGDREDELTRADIITYWEHIFTAAGSKLEVFDL